MIASTDNHKCSTVSKNPAVEEYKNKSRVKNPGYSG
jgi:hypothetical protein